MKEVKVNAFEELAMNEMMAVDGGVRGRASVSKTVKENGLGTYINRTTVTKTVCTIAGLGLAATGSAGVYAGSCFVTWLSTTI